MKLAIALACLALPTAAVAQTVDREALALPPGAALLNVTAEGRSERKPDLATFSAGVVTQAKTAAEAMAANNARMDATLAALRRAGIAERDLQTSTLQLQPQYYYPQREPPVRRPDGTVTEPPEPAAPRIIGYEARNTLTVRLRKIADMGRVIDTLVAAGANQVEGPYFTLERPEAAADEARASALRTARQRAELYAREAGFRTARILTISEGGGYYPVSREIIVTAQRGGGAMAPPPPPPAPVQPGEVTVGANLSVQFVLER